MQPGDILRRQPHTNRASATIERRRTPRTGLQFRGRVETPYRGEFGQLGRGRWECDGEWGRKCQRRRLGRGFTPGRGRDREVVLEVVLVAQDGIRGKDPDEGGVHAFAKQNQKVSGCRSQILARRFDFDPGGQRTQELRVRAQRGIIPLDAWVYASPKGGPIHDNCYLSH